MDFDPLFKRMVEDKASDLFLKGGSPPCIRLRGIVTPCVPDRLTREELVEFAKGLMAPEHERGLREDRELNFAFERPGIGRFRANVLWQQGELSFVIRRVQHRIPSFEELHLPAAVLTRLAKERQGLMLVTGPTANGKSTTISAIIDFINQTQPCHIVTLEDPVEFLFEEQRAIINQREVGVDTKSFTEGLRNVLRQSPDVLYLSDLRDLETIEAALQAAEAGQLVLSCLHTTNVQTTVERIIAFYPPHQQELIRYRLSLVLKGVVSIRLVTRVDGRAQLPACEVMVVTPTIRQLIREAKTEEIPALLQDGAHQGMQTQTQALYQLISTGQTTLPEALKVADNSAELQLAVREIRSAKEAFS